MQLSLPRSAASSRRTLTLLVDTFQQNYQTILAFLPWQEQFNVKSICRGIYYVSISQEMWSGIRGEVLDRKMEMFEDIQFVTEEVPKQSSKAEKQIRIHSLKKNNSGLRIRQASNVKEKKLALNTINNQLPFRSTEIGFKRLMRSQIHHPRPSSKLLTTGTNFASSSKDLASTPILDLVQLPKIWTSKDVVINAKDAWGNNLVRVDNLTTTAKKWNQFHHRVVGSLKQVEKEVSGLIKKCIKVDKSLSEYLKLFDQEIYKKVKIGFEGAQQNLLIDQQLNKLGKIFIKNHNQIVNLSQWLQPFISKTHESYNKISHKNQGKTSQGSTWVVQTLNAVEQMTDQWVKIGKQCPQLVRYLAKSILQTADKLLQDFNHTQITVLNDNQPFPLHQINVHHLSKKSQYFQLLFESYQNICAAVIKLCEGGQQQNMGLNLLTGKFKNLKTIGHCLWSISKYFSKLNKQLQSKEKKGPSTGGKAVIIRKFIQSYQNYKVPAALLDWKNPGRAEKQVADLKQRVTALKGTMQGQ